MEDKIDKAIETVLEQLRTNMKADEALKQTQAVLNMMHAKSIWMQVADPTATKRAKTS